MKDPDSLVSRPLSWKGEVQSSGPCFWTVHFTLHWITKNTETQVSLPFTSLPVLELCSEKLTVNMAA